MSKEWGRAALVLGIGGIVAWRSFTPETKQRVWQLLDDFEDAVARARLRQQQRAQQELAALPFAAVLLGGSLAPGEITDQHPPSALPDSAPHELGRPPTDPVQRAVSPTEPDTRWSEALLHPAVVLIGCDSLIWPHLEAL